jgi:mannose-6-phosphate isomerase-like protein (cupin superfamily)
MVFVESGVITVRIECCGRIVRAGSVETSMKDGATTLRQGDAAIISPGKPYSVQQDGAAAAVALGVTLYYVERAIDRTPARQALTSFIPSDASDTPTSTLPVAVQYLASGEMGGWPTAPASFVLGRVILSPGDRITPSPDNSLLVAVELGTLGIAGTEESPIAAGAGVILPAGSVRELRNTGGGLLVLLVLSVDAVAE